MDGKSLSVPTVMAIGKFTFITCLMGKLRRLTDSVGLDSNPSWSPDGKWLVYESYRNNNLDIYIMKADGSEGPYRLTENPALDFAPTWATGSGRHVAFISWRSGHPDIFVLSLDQVTDETAVNITNSPAAHEEQPAFSPDGRFLAYYEDSFRVSAYVCPAYR